jgi:hypothetical protein
MSGFKHRFPIPDESKLPVPETEQAVGCYPDWFLRGTE